MSFKKTKTDRHMEIVLQLSSKQATEVDASTFCLKGHEGQGRTPVLHYKVLVTMATMYMHQGYNR